MGTAMEGIRIADSLFRTKHRSWSGSRGPPATRVPNSLIAVQIPLISNTLMRYAGVFR